MAISNRFSRKITAFHGRVLPEEGILVGYALLLQILEENTGCIVSAKSELLKG